MTCGVCRNGPPEAVSQIRSNLLHASAAQALMHGIVFAVDGQQWLALTASLGGDQLSRSHQAFFVRQPDRFASANSFVGGFESCHAYDGADHEICFRMGGDLHGSRGSVNDFDSASTAVFEASAKCFGICFSGNRKQLRLPALGLFEGGIDISGPRREQLPRNARDRIQLR